MDRIQHLRKVFPNWKDDFRFGGTKDLVRIQFEENIREEDESNESEKTTPQQPEPIIPQICLIFISTEATHCQRIVVNLEKERYLIPYMNRLVLSQTLRNGGIYDLRDKNFVDSLQRYKTPIRARLQPRTLLKLKEFSLTPTDRRQIYYNTILSSALINNMIYCDIFIRTKTELGISTYHGLIDGSDKLSMRIGLVKIEEEEDSDEEKEEGSVYEYEEVEWSPTKRN